MISISNLVYWFEKYSFVIIVLFCFGFFSPSLSPKLAMMANDALATAEKISGSNAKKQIFWLAMFGFFIWRLFQNNIFTPNKWRTLCLLIIMSGGLALVSALWSDYTSLTIKRAIFQVIFCFSAVSAFYFAKRHGTIEISLFWGGALIIGLIAYSVVIGAGYSAGSLAGFTRGKNLLGQNLLVFIALLVLQIKLYGQRLQYTHILIAVLSVLLLLTISKTSILLLIIFILVGYSSLFLSKVICNFAFIVLLMCFIFIPSFSYFLGDYIHAGQYLEPDAITGRGIIWDTLYYDLEYFSKFLFGYGYGAYFSNGSIPYFFDDDWSFLKHIASAHSGYIDVLIQYGVIFSTAVIVCIYKLSSGVKNVWLSSAFIIPVIYNFSESTFLRDQSMMWLFAIILFSYVAILKDEYLSKKYTEHNNES